MLRKLTFGLVLLLTGMVATVQSSSSHPARKEVDFVVLTIPKCGTGLINKFFELSTTKKKYGPPDWFKRYYPNQETNSFEVENILTQKVVNEVFTHAKQNNLFLFSHFNFAKPFMRYIHKHPEWKCVIQIRDLRDACVSMIYWQESIINNALGPNATFDDKLMYVICASETLHKDTVFNIKASAERAVQLLDHPNVIVSRYEDLVGSQGGGDDKVQKQLIIRLAKELSIPMTSKKVEHIASILWGNEEGPFKPTFREGQIYKWKELFKPAHKEAFKKHFGNLLIVLGYETDNNW